MRRKLNKLNSLLGKDWKQDVKVLKERLKKKTPEEQKQIKRLLFQLAFAHWKKISKEHRDIIKEYIRGNLSEYNRYVLEETPVGLFRIPVTSVGWIIFIVRLMMYLQIIPKCSFILLSCNLLFIFQIGYKIRTLAEYLHREEIIPGKLLQILGILEINDDEPKTNY